MTEQRISRTGYGYELDKNAHENHRDEEKMDNVKKDLEDKIKTELSPDQTKATTIQSSAMHLETRNLGTERMHMEAARQSGARSDQVLTGSPAQEFGAQGQFVLKDIIDASDKLAREKYQAMQSGNLEAAEAMDGDGMGRRGD